MDVSGRPASFAVQHIGGAVLANLFEIGKELPELEQTSKVKLTSKQI